MKEGLLAKIGIVATILMIIACLIGIILTTNSIKEKETQIKELRKKQSIIEKDIINIRRNYDSTSMIRINELQSRDSLIEVLNKEREVGKYYKAQYKKVKGMYKDYSNDSLYKEIIKIYENHIARIPSIN